ncbi:MAG TPA: hypothetical protein PK176_12360 [Acidobacteriota bacterium]|nr:hypothetical protein [Acidobacteriota bacterium]
MIRGAGSRRQAVPASGPLRPEPPPVTMPPMESRDRTLADFAAIDAARARLIELAPLAERRRELLESFTRRVIAPAETGLAPLTPAADRPPADTETALARSVDVLFNCLARGTLQPADLADLSNAWNDGRPWRTGTRTGFPAPGLAADPARLAGDLAATLEWLAAPAVTMLHPVAQSVLISVRLTDLAPFPAGLFHLVRVTAWFPLLAADCPPPLLQPDDAPRWLQALQAGLAYDTRPLAYLYRERIEAAFAALFLVV